MLIFHTAAFCTGFFLDLLFGDPHWMPHPVRLIGRLVAKLEQMLYGGEKLFWKGLLLVVAVLALTGAVSGGILWAAYTVHPLAGWAVEGVMTYYVLALKCLKTESMKVYRELEKDDLVSAREAVSMIVGRDTQELKEEGVIRAAVETVAENTTDGVVAPLLYLAFGGPLFGFLYKAANTMDSMLGYKNERYLMFGRAAARLDDALNFVPARVSAWLMVAASFLGGKEFDGKGAYRIWRRDGRKHASPNSAQTEAACAGALGIRLAGPASYFGKLVEKPWIGDAKRPPEAEDIRRANGLLYRTAFLGGGICLALLCLAGFLGGC